MRKHKDTEITNRILEGEEELYIDLMDMHRDIVLSIVTNRIPSNDVAEVVHEVFVQAYLSMNSYAGKSALKNWISRIAVRTCYNYWREKYRYQNRHVKIENNGEKSSWLNNIPDLSASLSPDYKINQKDAEKFSMWALEQLSPEDRTLIESIYLDDMPLKEVAKALGWSSVNTRVRALRARKRMRKILESIGYLL